MSAHGRLRCGLGLAVALFALACGPSEPRLPDGTHLYADGGALRSLLAGFAGLEGTPLGRHARELGARLAGCAEVVGHAPHGGFEALLGTLACAPAEGPGAALRHARGEAELLLVLPAGEGQRVVATGSRPSADDAGAAPLERGPGDRAAGWRLDAQLDPAGGSGAAGLLLPAAGNAGPAVLAAGGRLVHARVRPRGGLDLAALVPEGSQGDRLFALKSALFGGAVLGEAWEIAVYMPRPGDALPPMAVALDVRRRELARAAAEEFVRALAATWPLHPTPARFAAGEGACLFDLRILPGFAPCWLTTERALVVGWSPASIEIALGEADAAGPGAAGTNGPSRLAVRLDRLAEADRRLQATRGVTQAVARDWGWRRLEVRPGGGEGALRIELLGAEPAG